jgi:hypothetical protein
MLIGLRRRPGSVSLRTFGPALARLVVVAGFATLAGFAVHELTWQMPAVVTLIAGMIVVVAVFVLLGIVARVEEIRRLVALMKRPSHAR